jgi:hypothetical protein
LHTTYVAVHSCSMVYVNALSRDESAPPRRLGPAQAHRPAVERFLTMCSSSTIGGPPRSSRVTRGRLAGPLRGSDPRQQRAGPLRSARRPDRHGGPEPPGRQCPEPAEGKRPNLANRPLHGHSPLWLASTSSRVEALTALAVRLPAPKRTCAGHADVVNTEHDLAERF